MDSTMAQTQNMYVSIWNHYYVLRRPIQTWPQSKFRKLVLPNFAQLVEFWGLPIPVLTAVKTTWVKLANPGFNIMW